MTSKKHWENVYTIKSSSEVSWFQERAELSVQLIRDAGVLGSASIIDVGGGASTLVDYLLSEGYETMTVLDLSGAALSTAKARLGNRAASVSWLEADVLEAEIPSNAYDVWHDRAVFHFLTDENQRQTYVRRAIEAVKSGGLVIVATFAEDGPTKCSGLPVIRYSVNQLRSEFGAAFELLDHKHETHHTPLGAQQKFVYCVFKKSLGIN